jgi:hypothetical protein
LFHLVRQHVLPPQGMLFFPLRFAVCDVRDVRDVWDVLWLRGSSSGGAGNGAYASRPCSGAQSPQVIGAQRGLR